MELLTHETQPYFENIKTGLRVDEMTLAVSKRVSLILLTLNRSKIPDSVHLLLEGKTNAALGLRVYSVYQEKQTRREGESLQALSGTDSSLALPYFHPTRAPDSHCEVRSRLEGRESEGKRRAEGWWRCLFR